MPEDTNANANVPVADGTVATPAEETAAPVMPVADPVVEEEMPAAPVAEEATPETPAM